VIRAVVAAAANMCDAVVDAAAMVLAEMALVVFAANVLHGVIAALSSQGDPRHGKNGDGRDGQDGLGEASVHGSLSGWGNDPAHAALSLV
jgi:hypothetical protein